MPYKDPEKERAYQKRYQETHAVEIKAQRKVYWEVNKDRFRLQMKVTSDAWYQANKERVLLRQQANQKAHPEKKKASSAAYRAANLEHVRAISNASYERHREMISSRRKVVYEERWAEKRAYHNDYYADNAEEKRAYNREYFRTHPEARESVKCAVERRRARKAGLPDTLTRSQWGAIKAAYKGCCAYCGKEVERLTQDHVIPIKKGGGTTADNIVPACRPCNSRKGTKDAAQLFGVTESVTNNRVSGNFHS